MNKNRLFIALLSIIQVQLIMSQDRSETNDSYLGQRRPGLIPEVFAPNIISTEYTEKSAFLHPNEEEFYFTIEEGRDGFMNLMVSKFNGKKWSKPKLLPIPNKESFGASVSSDGSKMIFASIDLIDEKDDRTEYNLWVMERLGESWGEARPLGPGINSPNALEMFPSLSDDGTLYFKRFNFKDDTERIYLAENVDGEYHEAKLFDTSFNNKYFTEDPFVSPDETYVIFNPSGPDLYGPMHICFIDDEGNWSEPKDMGLDGSLPALTSDRKYMFFIKNHDIYWVDAQIIETLR